MRTGSLPSRAAAIAVAVLLLGAALWTVRLATVSAAADRARIALADASLASLRDGAHGAASRRDQDARLRAFVDATAWTLTGSSPELLSARLQQMTEAAAGRAGASVGSSRTMPPAGEQGFTRVGLELDLDATLPALVTMLREIESARPAIFVDRLDMQVPESGSRSQAADGQDKLAVKLLLSVYAAGGRAA